MYFHLFFRQDNSIDSTSSLKEDNKLEVLDSKQGTVGTEEYKMLLILHKTTWMEQ